MALVLHGEGPAGTPFPDKVPYCLCPGEEVFDAETHRLFMTLDSDDGRVRGKDLAGTCGVPLECDRVYVEVECASRSSTSASTFPLRLTWPDDRSFPIRSTASATWSTGEPSSAIS